MKNKPRFKDKFGNNVKSHFGIWKYFINKSNQEKEKWYISMDCRRMIGPKALDANNDDQRLVSENKFFFH